MSQLRQQSRRAASGGPSVIDLPVASAEAKLETEASPSAPTSIADGLEHPWGLDFLPDGDVDRHRAARPHPAHFRRQSFPIRSRACPMSSARGQGGLLDIAVSPDFAHPVSSSSAFPSRAAAAPARRSRGRSSSATAARRASRMWRRSSPWRRRPAPAHHFGSRIVFRPDGTLFITTGDRGEGERAQDMKITPARCCASMRTARSRPTTPRPMARNACPKSGRRAIATFRARLRSGDRARSSPSSTAPRAATRSTGPKPARTTAGRSSPTASTIPARRSASAPRREGYEQPLFYWDPSIAPSGLAVYEGDMFPEWKGDLLVGALKFQLSRGLDRDASGKIRRGDACSKANSAASATSMSRPTARSGC